MIGKLSMMTFVIDGARLMGDNFFFSKVDRR